MAEFVTPEKPSDERSAPSDFSEARRILILSSDVRLSAAALAELMAWGQSMNRAIEAMGLAMMQAVFELRETYPELFTRAPRPAVYLPDIPTYKPWNEPTPANRSERRAEKFQHRGHRGAGRAARFGTLPVHSGGWEPGMRTLPTRSGMEQGRALGRPTKRSSRKP